jgi:hypothetical protein
MLSYGKMNFYTNKTIFGSVIISGVELPQYRNNKEPQADT